MKTYTFWNNKGGTGKTSLCFQCVCRYATTHPEEKILVLDMCPQANVSELFLGSLCFNGSSNLASLQASNPIKTIAGYIDFRIQNAFRAGAMFNPNDYVCQPWTFHNVIPHNISLIAGDGALELQANFVNSFLNSTKPTGGTAFPDVIIWVKDLLDKLQDQYDVVFIDTNPSFSFYTQMAIAACQRLIVPIMADNSSIRAIENVLNLIYGISRNGRVYTNQTFNTEMNNAHYPLPKIHVVVKNRLTQYMGPASAYQATLTAIDTIINTQYVTTPQFFSRQNVISEIRDFQTAGVVSFAEAKPFEMLLNEPNRIHFLGRNTKGTRISKGLIHKDLSEIDAIVNAL